jgi:hypothetical protein
MANSISMEGLSVETVVKEGDYRQHLSLNFQRKFH